MLTIGINLLIDVKEWEINPRNEMPQQGILVVELLDVWGMDLMGPLPSSNGNQYILVVVENISKWVETIVAHANQGSVILKFL